MADAPVFPWTGTPEPAGGGGVVDPSWLACDVEEAARRLLGCRILSQVAAARVVAVVVEVEAYGGPDDPASHAATRSGITPRNAVMFGPPGRAYVYRSYGVHWCLNVVTGREGEGAAVLVRGLELLEGLDTTRRRRRARRPLAAGPGRAAEALGVDDALNAHDLTRPPLQLLRGWAVPPELVGVTGRVGVRRAAEWPRRFYVVGSPGVTPGARVITHPHHRNEGTRP